MTRSRYSFLGVALVASTTFAQPAQVRLTGAAFDKKIAALPPSRLADTPALDKAIATYFGGVSTQRTYIQTDKPLYQPGETIWFRADVRATKTLTDAAPGGATVQLVSPRGAVVAT